MTYIKPPHQYRDQSDDRIEELLSNYLVNSWSYSKLMTFSRNEKEFEMKYIYYNVSKRSASTVSGSAYHEALQLFFTNLKDGIETDIVDLEAKAFESIDELPANLWKLQKTTPTIEECRASSYKTASALISNFMAEVGVYTDEIKEIAAVEVKMSEWLKVNGVDIPMPCNVVIDLVVVTNDNKRVIIDHKSKRSFSDEKELKFTGGKQAITYALCYETATGEKIDEVWFIENKYSKNRDKSPQLAPFKITLDEDTRRLYEAQLYEPLRRMIQAVSDPDYVYLINDNDNFTDSAEIHEFWAQTMIAEVDDFNIPDDKKELVRNRLKKIRDASIASINPSVIRKFQNNASAFIQYDLSNKNMTKEEKIEHTLRSFGVIVKVQHVFKGYSSITFLLEVTAGTAMSTIHRYKLDIANALNVSSIRILKDLFVYEGKSYLAVESATKREEDLIFDTRYLQGMKIPLGLDNFRQPVFWDLNNQSTPHMLICGATGSGKSVSIKSTIEYAIQAGVDKVVIFDPKYEFTDYSERPNIQVFSDIEEIELQMMLLVEEMNRLVKRGAHRKTLVIFDEFADAVSASRKGNELKNFREVVVGAYKNGMPKVKRQHVSTDNSLEQNLKILLQKGRSSGFRIVSATQRASTKVITGDAKVNFPVQVCFRVPKEVDSKVVIDESGAEGLQGKGDGLIKSPEYADIVRFQAFYKPN